MHPKILHFYAKKMHKKSLQNYELNKKFVKILTGRRVRRLLKF